MARAGRCKKPVKGEFVEVRGTRYEKSCFNCFECGAAFTREEKKGAYPVGDRLLCYTHALAERRAEVVAKKAAKKAAEAAKAAELERAQQAKAEQLAPPRHSVPPHSHTPVVRVESSISILAEPEAPPPVAVQGAELVAKVDTKGFVRQGTRKVSRLPNRPNQKPAITVAEAAAQKQAVVDAEAAAASGAADDEEEDAVFPDAADSGEDVADTTLPPLGQRSSASSGGNMAMARSLSSVSDEDGGGFGGLTGGTGGGSGGFGAGGTGARFKSGSYIKGGNDVNPDQEDDDGLPTRGSSIMRRGSVKNADRDPFDAMWAGFSIPAKLSKFKLVTPGREILEIGEFMLIEKKRAPVKVFLVLCTDVALICKMIDEDCYELMCQPVERNKVKVGESATEPL
jgi:hypothetical protein